MLSPELQSVRMYKNYQSRLNPVWHRMLLYPYDNSGHQTVKSAAAETYGT